MHDIQILTEQNRSETLKIWIPLMDKLGDSLNIQLLGKMRLYNYTIYLVIVARGYWVH